MNWWHRNNFDYVGVLFVLLLVMFMILFMNAAFSRADGCLTVDVPPGAVISQYDGDTFEIFTFGPGGKIAIRVLGVDTPEMSRKKVLPDQPGAREAKEFTRQWLAKGWFKVETCGTHTFERVVGRVYRGDTTLADDLIAAGLGKKAPGGL